MATGRGIAGRPGGARRAILRASDRLDRASDRLDDHGCQLARPRRPRSQAVAGARRSWEASARRPVRRVLSRGPPEGCGDGHPSGAAGCPAAHAADPRTPTARRCPGCPGRVLLFGLAPGRACPVSPCRRLPGGRLVSVALVLASRRTGVTRYPAPESPDVPHAAGHPETRDRPVASLTRRSYRAGARGPGSSPTTIAAIARPRTACAAASRWTPSEGSAATSAPASRKDAPDWPATSR